MDMHINTTITNTESNESFTMELPITKDDWKKTVLPFFKGDKTLDHYSISCNIESHCYLGFNSSISNITDMEDLTLLNHMATNVEKNVVYCLFQKMELCDAYLDSYCIKEFVALMDQIVANSFDYDTDVTDDDSFGRWYFSYYYSDYDEVEDYMDWSTYGEDILSDRPNDFVVTRNGMVQKEEVDEDYEPDIADEEELRLVYEGEEEDEPEYTPFDFSDKEVRNSIRGRWVRATTNESEGEAMIVKFSYGCGVWKALIGDLYVTSGDMLSNFVFDDDDSPCGVLVEDKDDEDGTTVYIY